MTHSFPTRRSSYLPEFISAGHFTLPGTRTGFQLLHGTKVPSMSDWQTQMAGLVQTAPEDRTNPFNLGVSALLTPFRHFLQNALDILSSFDAFRMEASIGRASCRERVCQFV